MKILKAPRLRRGDLIGLVCPASAPTSREKIEKGAAYLEKLGYRVKLGQHVFARHGYLAGSDEERTTDFNAMVRDPKVKAIFAIRGGYGTPRLLPFIDYAALRRQPKVIAGYSDITALQLAIFKKTGLITFSGPMPGVEFWNKPDPYTEEHFWRLLTSTKKPGPLPNPPRRPAKVRHRGRAEGILLGGNLSLLVASLGTPFAPAFQNAILALEEIAEEPYRVDRMLVHLRNAGLFRQLAGLAVGHFTDCVPADRKKPHLTTRQVFDELLSPLTIPTVEQVQFGHIRRMLTLPLGARARLDANKARFEILESVVS